MAYKIAFYKSMKGKFLHRLFRWAIAIWTCGKYSHCEFIDTKDTADTTQWQWIGSTGREHGCVAVRNIEAEVDKWDVFDLPADIDFKPAMDWGLSKLGYKYDWVGIFLSQILPWSIDNPNMYFCSEFTAEQLKKTELMANDKRISENYSPNSLYRKLKKIGALTKWQP